jgi:hypothetical protein
MWGDDFGEADRNVVTWGTGYSPSRVAPAEHVALTPNQEGLGLGSPTWNTI